MSDLNLFIPKRAKPLGRRSDKVATQIKECLAAELIRGDFPIFSGRKEDSVLPVPITVTYVDLSADLRNAVVYFMPLGGIKREESEKFLKAQSRYFKSVIAKKIRLKFAPEIVFKLDESFDYSKKIENLLSKN